MRGEQREKYADTDELVCDTLFFVHIAIGFFNVPTVKNRYTVPQFKVSAESPLALSP